MLKDRSSHIHKLKKHKYPNGTEVYFCVENCNFKVEAPLAVGKVVLCHRCNKPFQMTESSIKRVRPHCESCSRRRVKDNDGNTRYVTPNVLSSAADAAVADLKSRLEVVTYDPSKEDI